MTGPHLWVGVAVALGVVVVVLLGVSRHRALSARVGSFDCAVREPGSSSAPWVRGIAQYGAEQLYWWRRRSLAARPSRSWRRRDLAVLEHTPLRDHRGSPLVVSIEVGGHRSDLVMSREAYAGLTSWIEATPPTVERIL